ncbi:MAG: PhzF family phenazine biosynthesis protein [Deltaproteobacteria bacterium]|nr:PhzF family phenazine biosynthesis protein [Deltaproteobacteria bacterium]
MIRKAFLVDSLVDGPFSGAPTSVVFLESPMDKFKMLSLANEIGTSQTVYVLMHDQASYLLRFFSRTQELPLGGHSCHAAAHLIYELGFSPPGEELVFLTQEGEISARRVPPDQTAVRFAAQAFNKMDQNNVDLYSDILGLSPRSVAWAGITQNRQAILAVDASAPLRRLEPVRAKLLNSGATTLAVTAPDSSAGCDYSLRCFTPGLLFPEHLVSATVHRSLAPQWGRLLRKTRLQCRQLSSRGGLVLLDVSDPGRVLMTAKSRTVMRSDVVMEMMDSYPDPL